ncbi:MAG: alpha/beta hydrolase family protein [Phycisphaerae bacterium]
MLETRINKIAIMLSVLLIAPTSGFAVESKEEQLLKILGNFPTSPPLQIETLESVKLDAGWRHKIEYIAEQADPLFDRPIDKIRAYLFVPDHREGQKLPAIVAIHQDGHRTHLGKLEPAGLAGDKDQQYGLELFKRGYVVICPDRMRHAERRRIPDAESAKTDMVRDNSLAVQWCGQLILSGRTYYGKEIYDLMRATDVLYSLDYVDKNKIGAIGHSGGGNILVYYMFVDKRVKVGVSSCGFFELLNHYNENAPKAQTVGFALPGLAEIGKSADYLALLAPRPFLMTRGKWECGKANEAERSYSSQHVTETKDIEDYVKQRYNQLNASENLKAIYFDEGGGNHAFPSKVRQQAYQWLDNYLK